MRTISTRRSIIAIAAGIAVLAPVAAAAGSGRTSAPGGAAVSPEGSTVVKTFTGSALTAGISAEGNVMRFESMGSTNHVSNDGYLICYDGLRAFDSGFGTAGFGAPTVSYPSATKMRVIRTSVNDRVKLQQDLTFSNATKRVTVKHTITNVSASTITDVVFRRFTNFNANGTPLDTWGRTFAAVLAYDNDSPGGAMLQHVSASGMPFSKVLTPGGPANLDCSPSSLAVPDSPTDLTGTLEYRIGDLAAGKSTTISVAMIAI